MIRRPPRSTHSFPTRRSSDPYVLYRYHGDGRRFRGPGKPACTACQFACRNEPGSRHFPTSTVKLAILDRDGVINHDSDEFIQSPDERSEEHTSELQSLMRTSYAVFRLKKTQT